MKDRPGWDLYFLSLAIAAASRSTCDRAHVGCVIADKQHHVLATGYNGSPPGEPHCDDVGHIMEGNHCIRTKHAERNARDLARQRDWGSRPIEGSTAYVTHRPCRECAEMLVMSGVSRIVFCLPYDDGKNIAYLEECGIQVQQIPLADVLAAIASYAQEIVDRAAREAAL